MKIKQKGNKTAVRDDEKQFVLHILKAKTFFAVEIFSASVCVQIQYLG